MSTHYDTIIIGGGASGMMAACTASSLGKKVLLIEKNKTLGNKLSISGGGRCNITNAEYDIHTLLKNYGTSADFLYSAFAQFGVHDTFSFFESRGLPIIIEANKRAFPASHKATDVTNLLINEMKKNHVDIHTALPVSRIESDGEHITGVFVGTIRYTAEKIILATGGLSRPETGSTGDGFSWLARLGHTIHNPNPSLVPVTVQESFMSQLAGISYDHMAITLFQERKKLFRIKGRVLFTHQGLSGPLILNHSQKISDALHNGYIEIYCDFFPERDHKSLDIYLLDIFHHSPNKQFKNILSEIVAPRMVPVIASFFNESLHSIPVHSITKDVRKYLIQLLKALPLTIDGLQGYDKAIIADGGVPLHEIDMKTMNSKKIKNLYITGDLLHITRPSGGFSLQLCWTTGYVAGMQ